MKILFSLLSVLFLVGCLPPPDDEIPHLDPTRITVKEVATVDSSLYVNERFSYKFNKLEGFDVENLPSNEGIVMTKWIDDVDWLVADKEGNLNGYKVEIGVHGEENFLGFEALSEFVESKYPGYSVSFSGDGVFVDEGRGDLALRHYFIMDEAKDIIYEAYLKLTSQYYNHHIDGFNEFVKSIEIY